MAKKSMINREKNRKYAVRVRNRCKVCGRPRVRTIAGSGYAAFACARWHCGAKSPG